MSFRFGYSCAVTTSKALNSRSFSGDKPTSCAAVSSNAVNMRPYLPYLSTTAGGGVSHSRMATRNGVFILIEGKVSQVGVKCK